MLHAERALSDEHCKQHEQVDDRDAEQPLRHRLGRVLRREVELQRQHHHHKAAEGSGGAVGKPGGA